MKLDINKALITAEVLAWTFIVTTFALNLFGFEVVDTTISNPYVLQFVTWVDGSVAVRFITNVVFGTLIVNLMYISIIHNYFNLKSFLYFNLYIFTNQIVGNVLLVFNVHVVLIFLFSCINYFVPYVKVKNIYKCLLIGLFDIVFVSIMILLIQDTTSFSSFLWFSLDYTSLWILFYIKLARRLSLWFSLELVQDFLKKKLIQLKTWLTNMRLRMLTVKTKMKKHGLLNALVQLMKESRFYIRHALIHKFKRKVLPHVIVYGLYLGYAVVVDKVLQAVFLYIAYVCFYRLFPKHFHADYIPGIKKNWITRTCVCLSALMLCTALHNVIGGGLSVMSSIVVAFAIDWILYVIRDWLDFNLRYETDFTKYGLSIEMSNFAYDWKVTGLRDKELMIKYEINSVNTLNSRKRRIKQAMHTK